MDERDFQAAVDAVVARWHQDHCGTRPTCVPFAEAKPAQCHDNAVAYVAQHGGEVVHGFLVQHPSNWTMVWVMAHSVVWTGSELIDVTLTAAQLRGLSFFILDGSAGDFAVLAKRFPRENRPVAAALHIRTERGGWV
jgi:hypothetical protein